MSPVWQNFPPEIEHEQSPQKQPRRDLAPEFRAFLQLLYSLCKQYIAFYEREIKAKN